MFTPRILAACLILNVFSLLSRADEMIRVVVWDEQQPQQKSVYSNFLGNEIATHFKTQTDLQVTSRRLDDPEQGIDKATLDQCDVLVWWGHVRNREIKPETGKEIVRRVKSGQLSLISLHSAHWSTPFVEAMNERARADALKRLAPDEASRAVVVETNRYANFYTPPKYDDFLTPYAWFRKQADGQVQITLAMPNCCFPAFRGDGKPSQIRTLLPRHPIAAGVAKEFTIAQTEMYNEPFHVPAPDEVVCEERWAGGEWFRSGSVWKLGRGRVFYFRPGHELYPVFKDQNVLKILDNAVHWLAAEQRKS